MDTSSTRIAPDGELRRICTKYYDSLQSIGIWERQIVQLDEWIGLERIEAEASGCNVPQWPIQGIDYSREILEGGMPSNPTCNAAMRELVGPLERIAELEKAQVDLRKRIVKKQIEIEPTKTVLSNLRESDRAIIRQRYCQQLSIAEIGKGEAVEITRSPIYTRLAYLNDNFSRWVEAAPGALRAGHNQDENRTKTGRKPDDSGKISML